MRISVCFLYCLHNTFSGITDVWYYWCQMLVCLYTCVLWCVVCVLLLYAQRCYRVTCNDSCETVSATEIPIFLLLHCVYMYSTQRGQGRTCRWLISLGSSASHSWRGRSARQVEGTEQKLLLFCKKNEKDASFCTSRSVIWLFSHPVRVEEEPHAHGHVEGLSRTRLGWRIVETCTSFMGIYLIRKVRWGETNRMHWEGHEKTGPTGTIHYELLVTYFRYFRLYKFLGT